MAEVSSDIDDALGTLGPAPSTDEVMDATIAWSARELAASSTSIAMGGPGGPAGAQSLTDLSDVSGEPGPNKSPVGDQTGSEFTLLQIVTQEDLDAILASVAAVEWRPLQLEPGLTPFGQGFADPRYRLTLNNVVHVEGMVACSPPLSEADTGKVITQLAADSLPGAMLLFGCPAFGNNARVDVLPTGEIVFQGMLMGGGQIDWFSLSVVNFSVGA